MNIKLASETHLHLLSPRLSAHGEQKLMGCHMLREVRSQQTQRLAPGSSLMLVTRQQVPAAVSAGNLAVAVLSHLPSFPRSIYLAAMNVGKFCTDSGMVRGGRRACEVLVGHLCLPRGESLVSVTGSLAAVACCIRTVSADF
jgi:hypothetical protein